jgi:HAMP domain-containing protein
MALDALATGWGSALTSREFDVTPLVVAIVLLVAAVWLFRLRLSIPLVVGVLLGGLVWTTVAGTYGAAVPTLIAAIALFATSRIARDLRRNGD